MDAGLKRELEAKVYAGERLTRADGAALHASDDLAWLGRLAHHRRTERNGDRVLFRGDTAESDKSADSEKRATARYGAGEEWIDEVLRLRERQERSGEFAAFVPLPEGDEATPTAPAATLKAFAIARLLFDNVPHIGAVTTAHGRSVAQLVLNFGADDLTGDLDRDDLLELIWDAGLRPVERDAGYAVVEEFEPAPTLASRRSEPQQVWA